MTSGIDPDDLAEAMQVALKMVLKKKGKKAPEPRKPKKIAAEYDPSRQARKPQTTTLEDWEKTWKGKSKKCPKCGKTKDMVTEFGAKPQRGVYYVQSWCRTCRATMNYNNKPRKYQTRNS